MLAVKLRREWGPHGGFVVAIPGDKVALLGWQQGDELSVDCAGKRLVVTRIPKQFAAAGEDLATNTLAEGNLDN